VPRDRQHPRRLGRHRPPVVHAEADVSRETSVEVPPVEEQVHQALVEAAAQAELPPPPLPKERIARLEALTAVWMREVRVGGPGPDDTLLYAAPKPPPPPVEAGIRRAIDTAKELPQPTEPPQRITDWTSRHDERSRGFDVSDRIKARVPIQDRLWDIGPVFDQGTTPPLPLRDASGCVGMATAAAGNVLRLASAPVYGRRGDVDLLEHADALHLYDRAQALDHLSGNAYAGTSVLAGMKAGVEAGLWSSYLWAFGTRDVAQALLQVGPVVIGIPWFDGMEDPDAQGVIRPTGRPAGGHAMCLVGLVASRPGGPWFVAQQSRGPGIGQAGRVLIHHRDLSKLLAGAGEAAIPVPPGGVA
jgi:hypothetical protein